MILRDILYKLQIRSHDTKVWLNWKVRSIYLPGGKKTSNPETRFTRIVGLIISC